MADAHRNLEEAHAAIEQFLRSARQPVLFEPGTEQFPLTDGNYAIEFRPGRLVLEVWDERRNLSRRVTGVRGEHAGRLELTVEHFGKRTGTLELLDLARPRGQTAARRGGRLAYREQFRRSLLRQFPGWRLRDLTTEPDLEHSLSPAFPRALLVRGTSGIAAIGAPPDANDPSGVLTFGLLWLDYLRQREPNLSVAALAVFIPENRERNLCLRLRYLDRSRAEFRAFVYGEHFESEVDLGNYGNVDTVVTPRAGPPAPDRETEADRLIARLAAAEDVEIIDAGAGERSLRVRGLEFARERGAELWYGIETARMASASNLGEIEALARELGRLRTPRERGELAQRAPELWLESQVRKHIQQIDASLLPAPIYGQVPALAAAERGVIDLLAVDHGGRLAVLELKVTEDPQLPMQALDYWIRVRWHLERGDFGASGYFKDTTVRTGLSPRLLLIAPALSFHPSTEAVVGWFEKSVEVERVGLSMDWRERVAVMFRMRGADAPRLAKETG